MKLNDFLLKYAPNWAICREIKLLHANNRLIEAFLLKNPSTMALTKLEKFVIKRAFKELRRKKERELLKQWAVKYALTGTDDMAAHDLIYANTASPYSSILTSSLPHVTITTTNVNQPEEIK